MPRFTLPPLNYDYETLNPHIDTKTMQLHHDMHHQNYITTLNNEITSTKMFEGKTLNYIIENINDEEHKTNKTIRNNAGGHYNHSLFWLMMNPVSNLDDIEQELKDLINFSFGSFSKMQDKFNEAAKKVFGSGWAWLCYNRFEGILEISTGINQDNPWMDGKILIPILGIDVWEHAYYLKYQNKRVDYITAWWNIVDWKNVNRFYFNYAKLGKIIMVNDDGTVGLNKV
ncbi:hypothetical protein BDAP_001626 [Binucleata daphniae]